MLRTGLTFITVMMFSFMVNAQVAIGTVTVEPSAMLELSSTNRGFLLPRLTTTERNAMVNPANGSLIYNSTTNSLNINTGTPGSPVWEATNTEATKTARTGQSAKYSNSDTSTNLNSDTAIELPVYGQEEWNDNTSLFSISGNTMQIGESGRFKLNINVSLQSNSSSARKSPEIFILVNGTVVGSIASTGYMRRNNGHEESSLHLNEILELNSGDLVTVEIRRIANSGNTILRSAGSSNFYIEKID